MKKNNNKNNLPVIANFGGFIERNCHGDYAEIVRKKKTQARRRFRDQKFWEKYQKSK